MDSPRSNKAENKSHRCLSCLLSVLLFARIRSVCWAFAPLSPRTHPAYVTCCCWRRRIQVQFHTGRKTQDMSSYGDCAWRCIDSTVPIRYLSAPAVFPKCRLGRSKHRDGVIRIIPLSPCRPSPNQPSSCLPALADAATRALRESASRHSIPPRLARAAAAAAAAGERRRACRAGR